MSEQSTIPIRRETTDVFELLRTSLRPLVEQAVRSRIELQVAKLGDVPFLHVDREKLAWSVTALVGNALRYVAHGKTENEVAGSILVHVTHEPSSKTVSISVQDDGPGIPDDTLPFLFERRRNAAHADGLTLSLVRQIVAAHGGYIAVESRRNADDHGTNITLALPLHL